MKKIVDDWDSRSRKTALYEKIFFLSSPSLIWYLRHAEIVDASNAIKTFSCDKNWTNVIRQEKLQWIVKILVIHQRYFNLDSQFERNLLFEWIRLLHFHQNHAIWSLGSSVQQSFLFIVLFAVPLWNSFDYKIRRNLKKKTNQNYLRDHEKAKKRRVISRMLLVCSALFFCSQLRP